MWRFLGGAASAMVLLAAGFFLIKSMAETSEPVPMAKAEPTALTMPKGKAPSSMLAAPMTFADRLAPPPSASEKSKEEKRFDRFDKDKNGAVSRVEYLTSRRKAYTKLDTNGDGQLSFEEYAIKTVVKFAKADGNRSQGLDRREFSTTRPLRKAKPKPKCAPSRGPLQAPSSTSEAEEDA
jgi:hypothetical protein